TAPRRPMGVDGPVCGYSGAVLHSAGLPADDTGIRCPANRFADYPAVSGSNCLFHAGCPFGDPVFTAHAYPWRATRPGERLTVPGGVSVAGAGAHLILDRYGIGGRRPGAAGLSNQQR